MDTTRSKYKLPIHEHPLLPSARFLSGGEECDGCHVREKSHGFYFCNESNCYDWFHKECANAPPEINHHPSHPEHPLILTINRSDSDGTSPCDCCGQKLLSPCYTCPTCDFKVDLICGIKPSPSALEHPVCHDHPLVFSKKREEEVPCEVCKESIGGPSYSCLECNGVYFHLDCVHLSKEVNHPCHSTHLVKIIASESLVDDDDANKTCHFCLVQPGKMLYHCSICNFTLCLGCTKNPPPLVVDHAKTHMHPLRLFSSNIAFTCKVCGLATHYTMPYLCVECDYVVHGHCVGLPQVVSINRHDHRISFTHHLGRRRIKCGVCRESVSQYYGAYSCSVCPKYAVHARCVIDKSMVWDGKEQEGIPEINEDVAPFKVVVEDNLIRHFLHEKHTLKLMKEYYVEDIHDCELLRCEACIRPIGFGPIYSCEECLFILHEKCANLPMKKKVVFAPTPQKLEYVNFAVECVSCRILSCGFKYTPQVPGVKLSYVDVHCASLSEPLVHDGHLHPLYYFDSQNDHQCDACLRYVDGYILRCDACDFDLCFCCATLPEKIWHRSDEHPLTLYRDGKANSENWCDVCEMELQSKWCFTCSDCEVNMHVQCVLGDFSLLKPGLIITVGEREYKVVLNNHNTRPFCTHCHSRCKVPVVLKDDADDNGCICSTSCLMSLMPNLNTE